ncbi:hypothetical protein ACVOMV_30155 [Mesorhizobium atlanticum]
MNAIDHDEAVDHRSVITSLTNEERGRLTGKSDGPGLVQLALHLGAIIVLGALIAAKVPFWPVLMLPQGILIVFLFTLLHGGLCTGRRSKRGG